MKELQLIRHKTTILKFKDLRLERFIFLSKQAKAGLDTNKIFDILIQIRFLAYLKSITAWD